MERKRLEMKKPIQKYIGKVQLVGLCGASFLLMGITFVDWQSFFSRETTESTVINLEEIDKESFPQPLTLHEKRPTMLLNGINVATMTRQQQRAIIMTELEELKEQTLIASYGDQELMTTLGNLGLTFAEDLEVKLDSLEQEIATLKTKPASQIRLPFVFEFGYTFSKGEIDSWVQSLANQLNVTPIEPTLTKANRGEFNVTQGRTGSQVLVEQLRDEIATKSQHIRDTSLHVRVNKEEIHPVRSARALATVDTRIAMAESHFDRSVVGRAANVTRGAELISGTLIMPGETFSFNRLVYPVTTFNGFHYGTIFMYGEVAEGIGGGLCQVSSTLYWAQLRTGILATWRQAHSRPVFYVPRGLDATMFIGAIDYQFKNTLDYPLYINAYIENGTLRIEFWSSTQALGGQRFEPRTARVATTETTKSYDTFLRTYDAATNQLISEVFIHRSTYRTD